MKDWIDEGLPTVYGLREGHVAHSPLSSSGHPIVGNDAQSALFSPRVNVINVSTALTHGPCSGLSDIPAHS